MMSVSPDDVRWAFRLILGREPESDDAIASHLGVESITTLRDRLLQSTEFRASLRIPPHVGRYLDSNYSNVQVSCDNETLKRMLDGIAHEWIGFGQRDPHWSVLVDDRYFSYNINLHKTEFYSTGYQDIGRILNMVRRSRPGIKLRRALDFGCGVGRLSLALADYAESVLGIDISPPHLEAARDYAREINCRNAKFESIAAFDDIASYNDFDLVISLIVLQHNPPPVMAKLLSSLLGTLGVGGVAVIQMPTFLEGWSFSVDDYFSHQQASMEMNALPQADIFRIINEANCVPLEVREDGQMGDTPGLSHTFLVERQK